MSHLHIPDGLLPVWMWGAGLLVALAVLVESSRRARARSPQRIAYQGALGGLMLAAMAIPLGPFEYHVTLAGPMGILLGGAGAFPAARRPRVVWLGMDAGARELVALAAALERALKPRGFERESRAFSPHLTIGRVRESRDDWTPRLAEAPEADPVRTRFRVDRLSEAQQQAAYRYLTDSVSRFPDARALKAAMEESGFARVSFIAMNGGIVCVHTGIRL